MAVGPAAVSCLETDAERARIDEETGRLVRELAALGAERVVLFGSRARGRAIRGSDVDILVVMACPAQETFPARLARVWEAVRPRVAVDLLVYTPDEIAVLGASRAFIRDALAEGRVLHAS